MLEPLVGTIAKATVGTLARATGRSHCYCRVTGYHFSPPIPRSCCHQTLSSCCYSWPAQPTGVTAASGPHTTTLRPLLRGQFFIYILHSFPPVIAPFPGHSTLRGVDVLSPHFLFYTRQLCILLHKVGTVVTSAAQGRQLGPQGQAVVGQTVVPSATLRGAVVSISAQGETVVPIVAQGGRQLCLSPILNSRIQLCTEKNTVLTSTAPIEDLCQMLQRENTSSAQAHRWGGGTQLCLATSCTEEEFCCEKYTCAQCCPVRHACYLHPVLPNIALHNGEYKVLGAARRRRQMCT